MLHSPPAPPVLRVDGVRREEERGRGGDGEEGGGKMGGCRGGEEREGRGRREMRGEERERREMRREGKVGDEREVATSTSTYNCVHTGIHTHTHT